MSTFLYSNDSSYGGISFIANELNFPTLLYSSVRKDFDSMIKNIFFINNNNFHKILKSYNNVIIFGTASFLKFMRITNKKYDNITLIITDSTFVKKAQEINILIKKLNIHVLIMPDLIKYLDRDIKYKPYFQHINLNVVELLAKSTDILISHSPGLKFKSDLKGTSFIKKELSDYNLDIIYNESWENCIKRKSKSHIFIDQVIKRGKYIGGLGKSGLEAMLLDCLTLTSGSQLITTPYFPNPPIIIVSHENLKEVVDYYVNDVEKYRKKVKEQKMWAKTYLSLDFVKNNILSI